MKRRPAELDELVAGALRRIGPITAYALASALWGQGDPMTEVQAYRVLKRLIARGEAQQIWLGRRNAARRPSEAPSTALVCRACERTVFAPAVEAHAAFRACGGDRLQIRGGRPRSGRAVRSLPERGRVGSTTGRGNMKVIITAAVAPWPRRRSPARPGRRLEPGGCEELRDGSRLGVHRRRVTHAETTLPSSDAHALGLWRDEARRSPTPTRTCPSPGTTSPWSRSA